jgi:uncharacterized protein DUF4190
MATADDMRPCPYCRESIKSSAIKCRYCGEYLTEEAVRLLGGKRRRSNDTDEAVKWLIPVKQNIWAFLAGYAGIVSLFFPPAGLVAIFLGIYGYRQIARNPGERGKGRAIFGIVAGGIGLLGCAIIVGIVLFKSHSIR